jgi:hypothetical protein
MEGTWREHGGKMKTSTNMLSNYVAMATCPANLVYSFYQSRRSRGKEKEKHQRDLTLLWYLI